MTKQELKKKWLVILFFCSVSFIFVYFIYFLSTGTFDTAYRQRMPQTEALNASPQEAGYFLLQNNKEIIVGNLKLIYLGLDAETLVLDLTLMDLDPQYAYRHRIPLNEAKQGFSLAGARFQAFSVTPIHFRLERRP